MCTKFSLEEEIQIKEQISYDPVSGIVSRISKPKGSRAKLGPIKGTKKKEGHLKTYVCGKEVYLHQLAWFLYYGVWATKIIDHKDRNPSNNKVKNLRELTQKQNVRNQSRPTKTNSCGYLGVYFDKSRKKYVAEITVNMKKKYLGRFSSAKLAHEAYLNAKKIYHPSYHHI